MSVRVSSPARRAVVGLLLAALAAAMVGLPVVLAAPTAAEKPATGTVTPPAATPTAPKPGGAVSTPLPTTTAPPATPTAAPVTTLPPDLAPTREPVSAGEQFRLLVRFGAAVFGRQPVVAEPEPTVPETPETPPGDAATATPTHQTPTPGSAAAGGTNPVRAPGVTTPAKPSSGRVAAPPGTPVAGAPVPATYILGGGDVLDLHVWSRNREQVATTLVVSPEGFVFLPSAGRLSVAGQTVLQVRDLVVQAYERLYERPEVTLLVSGQRAVDVYVLGDVTQPGKYTLTGMATVFTALYAAGGPSDSGSFRQVRLERLGAPTQTVDLYDYLLLGERKGDVLLQSGDLLFVPPARTEIGVAGEVRRPARYELTGAVTLAEALEMAGGLGPQGYAPTVEVWRTGDHRGWELLNLSADQKSELPLRDGDLIVVKPLLPLSQQTVAIRGSVNRPGSYALTAGLTASQLLKLAEGADDGADLVQAVLWRRNERMTYDLQSLSLLDALAGKAGVDTVLQPRDIVYVPQQTPATVTVEGEVVHPGTYPFGPGMRVRDLIALADGPTTQAFTARADLQRWLQPQQQPVVVAVALGAALTGDEAANIVLQRLDVLTVKARDVAITPDTVHVDGFVKNPGAYPHTVGMKASDLLFAAGGCLPQADHVEYARGRTADRVKVEHLRIVGAPGTFRVEPDVTLQPDDRISVQGQGGFVGAPPVVLLRGQIVTQGAYALLSAGREGRADADTVWTVLQRAGGALPDADLNGIVVYRGVSELFNQMRDLEQIMRNENRESVAASEQLGLIADAAQPAMTQQVTEQLVQTFAGEGTVSVVIPPRPLKVEQSVRAIPVDGARLVATEGREGDVRLATGDVITVPRRRDTVAVVGAVLRPGAVPYQADLKIADYVESAGGPAVDAAMKRVVVLASNGSIRQMHRGTKIQAGDVILVPSQYAIQTRRTQSTWESALRALASAAALALRL